MPDTILLANPRKKLRQEILVAGIGFVLLFALVAFLGFAVQQRAMEIHDMRVAAVTKAEQVRITAELSRQNKEAEPFVNRLRNILPERDALIVFDQDLEGVADRVGLSGFGFQLRGESAAGASGVGSLDFSLALSGSFDEIVQYLNEMRELNYIIQFPGVSMEKRGNQFFAQLSGKVFLR